MTSFKTLGAAMGAALLVVACGGSDNSPISQATLTENATPAAINYHASSALSTTGGSGSGAVSYAITSGADVCSVTGSTLSGTGIGSCTVTATKAADANYNATTATSVITVGYSSMVSFGDSLSDVGTYQVGTVAALGGGQYTVNSAAKKNWTQVVAAQLSLAVPCAATTGLDGDPAQGFSVPQVNHAGCLNYAQGGSRVTNPVGPGNKLLGGGNAVLGQLTIPVVTQIDNHIAASGGKFSGAELVTVMAGANDVFINLGGIEPTIAYLMSPAGGSLDAATATNVASKAAVTAMGTAAVELASYVKTKIVAKGALQVAVINVPDITKTPFGYTLDAATQGLVSLMVTTFNDQLKAGLAGTAGVRTVDAYTAIRDQAANPAKYGLSNVTGTACNLAPAANPLGSSLVCSAANVNTGDVSKYAFADSVHPTPYGYQLLADLVTKEAALATWH